MILIFLYTFLEQFYSMKYIIFTLFNVIVSNAFCAIRYVTQSGAGAFNATSWSNAASGDNLQSVINSATTGDEIWVAAGTYFTTTGTNRAISFSMRNGIVILGSFAGTETLLSQRNLANGLSSILSGEIGFAGISDNSYHTISNSGLNNTAIIDGFIIRDANDDRAATITDGLGGGIYNNGSGAGNVCSPIIRNCLITNNYATFGGGIFNSGYNGGTASPFILNCVITNNSATGGAGIDNFGLLNGNASPTITNCVIYNNHATFRAGGMYCWGGNNGNTNPIVTNTSFVNNSAVDGGGVVSDRHNSGGGSSGNSNPSFRNCIFWGNTASGTGPQFFLLGGATFTPTFTDINLTGQTSPHIISGSGTGNQNVDPLFSNIAIGSGDDGIWLTHDDGLNLIFNSPLINAGDPTVTSPTTDIFGYPRTGIFDIGAYECRRYIFIGPGNQWTTDSDWDVGTVPPVMYLGTIIIDAECEKVGLELPFNSQLIINPGKVLTIKE